MLFRQTFLDGIRRGEVTLAFRRWTRPTVRSAGRLRTPVGELEIRAVVPVQRSSTTAGAARLAGYATLEGLLRDLDARPRGTVYRIELGALCEDPRAALGARAAAGGDALLRGPSCGTRRTCRPAAVGAGSDDARIVGGTTDIEERPH